MIANVYATKIDDAIVGPWMVVDGDTEIAIVFDDSIDIAPGRKLFARFDYDEASEVARANGATLVRSETLDRVLANAAAILEPYTLPYDALMASLVRCKMHDLEVWRRIVALGLPDDALILGMGKHHIAGAPPGRCYLKGWFTRYLERYTRTRRGAGWVQQGAEPGTPGPHASTQRDYATTTIIERRRSRNLFARTLDALRRLWGGT